MGRIRNRRLDAKARARYWANRAERSGWIDKATKLAVGASAASALAASTLTAYPSLWKVLCLGAAGGAFVSPVTSDPGRTAMFGQSSGHWLAREADWDELWRRAEAGEAVSEREIAAAIDKDDVVARAIGRSEGAAGLAKARAAAEAVERGAAG